MTKAHAFKKNAALERFLQRFPDHIAASFTPEQLQAMQTAIQTTQWRQHPVDIRLTLPLLWKRFYVVLIAGPERRSQQRRQTDRNAHPILTPANLLFVSALVGLGMLAAVGLFQVKSASLEFLTQPQQSYPAGIPFKADQKSCEESGRVWQNGECLDYNHDPTF